MMNQTKKIIALFALATLTLQLNAAGSSGKNQYYNFGYASFGGGYTSLNQATSEVTNQGSMALLGGLGYEFRYQGFWMNVGVQYAIKQSRSTVQEYSTQQYDGYDDQDPRQPIKLRYLVNQIDKQDLRTVDIPLMTGYYNNGFYIGVGAKVGFSAGTSITTTGKYEVRAEYVNFSSGEFHDMPEHGYTTYDIKPNKVACSLLPQFSILGEVGYDLLSSMPTNSTICHILKLGFYCEYGLNSARPKGSIPPLQINEENATEATINPYYLNEQTEGLKIIPFVVGAKLTYLIGGSRGTTGTWHKGCQCYNK